jgi:hypothetical protein
MGTFKKVLCQVRGTATQEQLLHVIRPAAASSEVDIHAIREEIQMGKLLNHENLQGLFGEVQGQQGVMAAVVRVLPYELRDALAGEPQLSRTEQLRALVDMAIGLEFLAARSLFFEGVSLDDVGLTLQRTAKLRCIGLCTILRSGSGTGVIVAFGRFLEEAASISKLLAQVPAVGTLAEACANGTLKTLCDLVLEAHPVSRTSRLLMQWR